MASAVSAPAPSTAATVTANCLVQGRPPARAAAIPESEGRGEGQVGHHVRSLPPRSRECEMRQACPTTRAAESGSARLNADTRRVPCLARRALRAGNGTVPASVEEGETRLLIRLVVVGVALWLTILLLPGLDYQGPFWEFIVVAAIFALVNAFIRPIAQLLSLPISILTLGVVRLGGQRPHVPVGRLAGFRRVRPGSPRRRVLGGVPRRLGHGAHLVGARPALARAQVAAHASTSIVFPAVPGMIVKGSPLWAASSWSRSSSSSVCPGSWWNVTSERASTCRAKVRHCSKLL